jgi:hypothetical protein
MKVFYATVVLGLISTGLVQAEDRIPKALYGYWEVEPKRAIEAIGKQSHLSPKEMQEKRSFARSWFKHGDESWIEISKHDIILGSHSRWGSNADGTAQMHIHMSTIYKYKVTSASDDSATVVMKIAGHVNNGRRVENPQRLTPEKLNAETAFVIRLVDGKWLSMAGDDAKLNMGPVYHRVSASKSPDKGLQPESSSGTAKPNDKKPVSASHKPNK